MSKTYYIAGPITGYPEFNFPAFHAAKALLESEGNKAISPADLDSIFGFDANRLDLVIRRDFEAVMQADGVYMLKGWEKSVGARAEHALAVWRGIEIRYENGDDSGNVAQCELADAIVSRLDELPSDGWVVEIENGVWLADWIGDPGRTVKLENAQRFASTGDASIALAKARNYRPLRHARIYRPTEPQCDLCETDYVAKDGDTCETCQDEIAYAKERVGIPQSETIRTDSDGRDVTGLTGLPIVDGPQPLQLREGAWYVDGDNDLHGPAKKEKLQGSAFEWNVPFASVSSGKWYCDEHGKCCVDELASLIREVPPPHETHPFFRDPVEKEEATPPPERRHPDQCPSIVKPVTPAKHRPFASADLLAVMRKHAEARCSDVNHSESARKFFRLLSCWLTDVQVDLQKCGVSE